MLASIFSLLQAAYYTPLLFDHLIYLGNTKFHYIKVSITEVIDIYLRPRGMRIESSTPNAVELKKKVPNISLRSSNMTFNLPKHNSTC